MTQHIAILLQHTSMIQDLTCELAFAWQGVFSALQGVKAENSFVLAIFLKILLLGSSGSIVAAKLIQSGTCFLVFIFLQVQSLQAHANDMLPLIWRPHQFELPT